MLIPQKCCQRDHCHMSYRQKQDQRMKDLEEYTRKLRREIWDLKCRRNVTLLSISTEPNVWTIALDYFRNFRYGLTETNYSCMSSLLGRTMARDVTDGSMRGPEAILSYWGLFSHNFDDILVELNCLEQGVKADSLIATITLSVTISKNTLRLLFPHLLCDDSAGLSLAAQLIDQRIVMRGSVLFQWDDKIKRLERIYMKADMLTPILKIVGNLEKVGHVFERALVTPECKLVPEMSNDFRYWMQFSKLGVERI
ncbi:hypothetical protein PHMEG_00031096 [Phytophthora megakarya]|uniref:Bzip transcription factor n=1 Tax=Phytophthora megakarya TaxID=4795 RepID=A0A225V031_9STRA|nr:hypothetical protein PHMEG_00031096 [Phytophthora megakarya]